MNAPPLNVALLTAVAGNGGSAATLFHNARLLSAGGWRCTFFATGDYWKERGAKDGVEVLNSLELRRGFRPLSFAGDYSTLRRFIQEKEIDALIVQKSPEQWLAAFALQGLKRPVALIRLRGVVFPIKPSVFNRWLHERMDAVICSASVIAEHFRSLPGFSMERVHVLLEGIDPDYFHPASTEERRAARTEFGLDPEALIVGTAGRPAPVKGHDILVRAFAKAWHETKHPLLKLAIFADESRRGGGSYVELRSLCDELKIRDRVTFISRFIPDMRSVYHALDAYVLPSLGSEGSSRAGLEACASGLPLLASRVGVLPDLIVENQTGILLPPGDIDALANHLILLANTWPDAGRFGAAARSRIENDLSEKLYAQKLQALIRRAVEMRQATARGK